jgi:hypothetical protein
MALETVIVEIVEQGVQGPSVSDGDKGDVTVSGSGSVWTIDSGVITDAKVNASAAIAGTKLANTPSGNIAATTVQAAINELDTEKVAKAGDTMTGALNVNLSGGSTYPAILTGSGARLIGSLSASCNFEIMTTFGTPTMTFRQQGGTWASPTAIASSQNIGNFQVMGHDGTSAGTAARGSFRFQGAEGWTPSAQGTRADVRVTPIGSTVLTTRLSIENNGDTTPGVDNTQALGTASLRWNSLRVGTATSQFDGDLTVGAGTGTKVLRINGGVSGANDGAAIYFQNGGISFNAMGNTSAILGAGYDTSFMIYTGGGGIAKFFGGTFRPNTDLQADLGTASFRWNSLRVGTGGAQIDGNVIVDGYVKPKSYTVGTVPSAASSGAGAQIYISNESGGAVIAFSDGTDWRRVTDRAIIS